MAISTGNAVSLDTDTALTPSLSVNAANPADVTFIVSGLESDYSGTVTFTDTTGKSDVVPIGSNGTYSADLSNLTAGTLTYLMTVSDPAGNVINVDPTVTLGLDGYSDGAANAPGGTAQLPTLLNGYAVRAPWQVAGVDYAVGPQPGVTFKDPSTINMAGVSVNTTSKLITITGDNVTLDGYDFATGGYHIFVYGKNDTISNFKIGVTSSSTADPITTAYGSGASNLTLKYGIIDGGGTAGSNTPGALVYDAASAGLTVEYCLLENAYQHTIEFQGNANIQYNLFNSCSFGTTTHGDFLYYGGIGPANSIVVDYNTFYQPVANSAGFPGGVVAALNASGFGNDPSFSGMVFDNNTGVGLGATGHEVNGGTTSSAMENWINWTNAQNGTAQAINPVAEDNYFTMSGNRFPTI